MDLIEKAFTTFPTLETDRLSLIEIKQAHLKDLFALFGDSAVTRYYNVKTLLYEEDGQPLLDWFHRRYRDRQGIRWGIALKRKPGIIGTIGVNHYLPNHRANIGYDLQSRYWNRGYTTEAVRAIVDFAFNILSVNRVEAEVIDGNIFSQKVLLKAGFTHEGMLRQWMYWDDRHFDMHMFSILKDEFLKK